jgi:hypothetical protein
MSRGFGGLSASDARALRLGGFGVAAILAVVLVGFPALNYWDGLNREVAETENRLRNIQRELEDAARATRTLETLRDTARLHESRASENAQTARLREQLERLPAFRSLTVARMEDLPLRREEDYLRSGVSLQFSTKLNDLYRFLKEVEEARPALKVDRLTVSAATNDTARVEGQLVVVGFGVSLQSQAPSRVPARTGAR